MVSYLMGGGGYRWGVGVSPAGESQLTHEGGHKGIYSLGATKHIDNKIRKCHNMTKSEIRKLDDTP